VFGRKLSFAQRDGFLVVEVSSEDAGTALADSLIVREELIIRAISRHLLALETAHLRNDEDLIT
jgi:hypothetical protein